jgi:hypothetical protein
VTEFCEGGSTMEKGGILRKIGFLSTGWWIIHFLGITIVYSLGHILWR